MRYIVLFLWILSIQLFSPTGVAAESKNLSEIKDQIVSDIFKWEQYIWAINIILGSNSHNQRYLNKIISQTLSFKETYDTQTKLSPKKQRDSLLNNYIYHKAVSYTTLLETPVEVVPTRNPKISQIWETPEFQVTQEEFDAWKNSTSQESLASTLKKIYTENDKQLETEIQQIRTWSDRSAEVERDNSRINDLQNIAWKIEKYYKENNSYPEYSEISDIVDDINPDPLSGYIKYNCRFWYMYEVWDQGQNYRVSSCLEDQKNTLLFSDRWIDDFRYELGSDTSYEWKGTAYTNNSDIYYFSRIDLGSNGGSIEKIDSWIELPREDINDEFALIRALIDIEYQRQNSWIDHNRVLFHSLNMLASAIDNYFLEGSILELIKHDERYAGKNIFISGLLENGRTYKTGKIKYSELGIKDIGYNVILGYANSWWGHYQIVGFGQTILDTTLKEQIFLRGTYNPLKKTLQKWSDFSITDKNTLQLSDVNNTYLFKRGESITPNTIIIDIDYSQWILSFWEDISDIRSIIFDQPDGLVFDPKGKKPYLDGQILK